MSFRSTIAVLMSVLSSAALPLAWGQEPSPTPPAPPMQPLPVVKPATEGKVWGALVFGSNEKPETPTDEKLPENLKDLSARLSKVFPYQHYEILGHHLQDVFREYESWVVPSKDLFLKVDSKGPAKGGGINLHLQFWRDQQVLVKTDAVLRSECPLFIAGPTWRKGQLIFVLSLQ